MTEKTMNAVYLGLCGKTAYPANRDGYSPHESYPEYPFMPLGQKGENWIYSAVRDGFYHLGYDQENYDKPTWNPLGEFIKEGDTVLLKPNWVMHYNKNKHHATNFECLVTHPSIVRAVTDYVLIALKGTGRVVIADAPMQGCDLEVLFDRAGYRQLFEFYRQKGTSVEVRDLRHCRVVANGRVITEQIPINDESQAMEIDLGEASFHSNAPEKKYKVSDYAAKRTNEYHAGSRHRYKISRTALDADVIINLPKPKCHRLAGITAAQKNLVGITFDKASLPHRTLGAKASGGDEYAQKCLAKKVMADLEEWKLALTDKNKTVGPFLIQGMIAFLYVYIQIFARDKALIGSWFGNDTIWRTVADLNYILKFVDKTGTLTNARQRKILTVADMIVAGEGNGPIGPEPKPLGMLVIGEDLTYVDVLCARIMGFSAQKIPGLQTGLSSRSLGFSGEKVILSNSPHYHQQKFDDFWPCKDWAFKPHDAWAGHIEETSASVIDRRKIML